MMSFIVIKVAYLSAICQQQARMLVVPTPGDNAGINMLLPATSTHRHSVLVYFESAT